ncbi:MAG TPA: type II toxin-antitoxin system VapC family toxin [Tepidisphaeraceae bacterium]|nr:type II toxin-antitoxin system VapC family toxin [Tepidisphaeraceae bacterium]
MRQALLDSNLIIYAASPSDMRVVPFISSLDQVFVSEIAFVETLGYHLISDDEKSAIRRVLNQCRVLGVSRDVIERAILVRQQVRVSLGDAIMAGTALQHDLPLADAKLGRLSGH